MIRSALPADSMRRQRSVLRVTLRPRSLVTFLLAVAYALVLVNLPLLAFRDRDFYINGYATYSDLILQRNAESGILSLLANEPAWLFLNIILSNLLSPEDVVRVIIFVPAVVVAWITLRSNPQNVLWLSLILLYPAVVKNHIIHLRQGVAIAVFLAGALVAKRSWLRWTLFFLSPFIHSSFFFVVALMMLANVSRHLRLGASLSTVLFVLATFFIVLSLEGVASVLGARQAEQYELGHSEIVSGVNFLFWFAILAIMGMEGKHYLRERCFEVAVIVLYLGMYFFTPIAARVFESGLLLVLIAGLHLTHWRGPAFKYSVVLFGLLSWLSGRALNSMLV